MSCYANMKYGGVGISMSNGLSVVLVHSYMFSNLLLSNGQGLCVASSNEYIITILSFVNPSISEQGL